MVENRMSRGNGKLHKSILCWAITPVKSCLNCSQCKDRCYALGPYKRWPNVKEAWDKNFELAKTGRFQDIVAGQIERSRNAKTVRIHVAGDFFNAVYVNQWAGIAANFPGINFYTYTKVADRFPLELAVFQNLDNCNVINSITEDGGVNFGDNARVEALVKLGYFVCPVTEGKDITCGLECSECVTNSKVCFHQHK